MYVQTFPIFLLVFICYGVEGACCNPNSNPANMQLCGPFPHAIPSPAKLNPRGCDVLSLGCGQWSAKISACSAYSEGSYATLSPCPDRQMGTGGCGERHANPRWLCRALKYFPLHLVNQFKFSRWFQRSAADLPELSYLEGFTTVHSYIIGEGTQIAM